MFIAQQVHCTATIFQARKQIQSNPFCYYAKKNNSTSYNSLIENGHVIKTTNIHSDWKYFP